MKKLACLSLIFVGCWDFESLTSGQVVIDAGPPADLFCGKTPNTLKEDCSDPTLDKNNDCRPGCEDTGCATTSTYCMGSRSQFLGAGTLSATAPSCTGGTVLTLRQNINPDCTGAACSCRTPSCQGTLSIHDSTDCSDATPRTVAFPPATACTAVTAAVAKTAKLSAITTANCTPSVSSVDVDAKWGVTQYLCQRTTEGLFEDLAKNYQCLVFTGDATCPATFTKKQTYYQNASGKVTCDCACNPGGTSCAISGNQVFVSSDATCKTSGGGTKVLNITQSGQCLDIKEGATAFEPKGVNFSAAATCQASSTVRASSIPTPTVQTTLCCAS
jgi:hypothetical protein